MCRIASNLKPSFYLCLPPECWDYRHVQPSQDLFCSKSLGSTGPLTHHVTWEAFLPLSGSLALYQI